MSTSPVSSGEWRRAGVLRAVGGVRTGSWEELRCSTAVLQGPEPEQVAATAADASARAAAQHLPHAAASPEREEHTAPCCRVTGAGAAGGEGRRRGG